MWFRGLVAVVFAVSGTAWSAAQSSDDAGVRACEASIIGTLRSPASYSLFKATPTDSGIEIIYDAANGFGALLRGKAACAFVATSDGLRLISEPEVAVTLTTDSCVSEVEGWVSAGNLTERAAKPFLEDCASRLADAQRLFLQSFEDLGVAYPVPPEQTSIQPIQ